MLCLEDSERYFGDVNGPRGDVARDVLHHILALCGEAGEVANLAKKADRGDYDPHSAVFIHDLAMELADVFIYMLNICGLIRVDLEAAFYAKRDYNHARFLARRAERDAARAGTPSNGTGNGAGISGVQRPDAGTVADGS